MEKNSRHFENSIFVFLIKELLPIFNVNVPKQLPKMSLLWSIFSQIKKLRDVLQECEVSEVMTAFGPNERLTFTFYVAFSKSIPYRTTFVKDISDSMHSSESDKMTVLRPSDISTFNFHATFTNSILL